MPVDARRSGRAERLTTAKSSKAMATYGGHDMHGATEGAEYEAFQLQAIRTDQETRRIRNHFALVRNNVFAASTLLGTACSLDVGRIFVCSLVLNQNPKAT